VAVSCQTGLGLEALAAQLSRHQVSVVAGPSGAGKSSLINALRFQGRHKPGAAGIAWQSAHEAQQQQQQQQQQQGAPGSGVSSSSGSGSGGEHAAAAAAAAAAGAAAASASSSSSGARADAAGDAVFLPVGDVSRLGRGRHTTRSVRLIPLPCGGLMADTPGFNQPTLDRISSAQLAGLFPEFVAAQQRAGGCRCARARVCVGGGGRNGMLGTCDISVSARACVRPFRKTQCTHTRTHTHTHTHAHTRTRTHTHTHTHAHTHTHQPTNRAGHAVACRFGDCMHLAEPGCAVTAAELQRHEHYVKFLAEIKVGCGVCRMCV
jgi:energy-coupling factor transporter ATP-binding protein EcfA2